MIDEIDGRTFRATATGPFYRADLDDPVGALVLLTSYLQRRLLALGRRPRSPDRSPPGRSDSVKLPRVVARQGDEASAYAS